MQHAACSMSVFRIFQSLHPVFIRHLIDAITFSRRLSIVSVKGPHNVYFRKVRPPSNNVRASLYPAISRFWFLPMFFRLFPPIPLPTFVNSTPQEVAKSGAEREKEKSSKKPRRRHHQDEEDAELTVDEDARGQHTNACQSKE